MTPALATDTTSANILFNIMDPLVKLDKNLDPTPALAESWDTSPNGKTVTFHLRGDGKWTNGDPVTAQDFEFSWKRTVSPELGADYAYQFYGIVGAQEYNACTKNCAALRDKVGVKALDRSTLQVQLTSAQPWFLQQVAHHSFLAVNPRPSRNSEGSGPSRGTSSRTARSTSRRGSTTPASTSRSGRAGAAPTASRSNASTG